jgi:hypothetical protein
MAAVLLVDLVIILIGHTLKFRDTQQALYLVYWLLGSLAVVSTWEVIWYRRFFGAWSGWLAVWLAIFLGSLVSQGVIPVTTPPLPFIFLMLYITGAWTLGPASAVLLWYKDAGLRFWALGSVITVWVVTISWKMQGNFFQMILSMINEPQTPWWVPAWLCLFFWILPLAVIAFFGHTLRMIIYEVFQIENYRNGI